MAKRIHKFYAVTQTSVYCVTDKTDKYGCPIVKKIALRGESRFGVGERLEGGFRVAITKRGVFLYVASSHSEAPERVNDRYWGDTTSPIIGLFLKEEDAMACFNSENLEVYDKRWWRETEEILNAIGTSHPVFTVSRFFDRYDF